MSNTKQPDIPQTIEERIRSLLPEKAPCDKHEDYDACPIDYAVAKLLNLVREARNGGILTPDEQLLEQNKRLIEAGDVLYERASYTGRTFDGTHRLLSAAAKWLDVRGKNSGKYQAQLRKEQG